jgi:hypothetical protein
VKLHELPDGIHRGIPARVYHALGGPLIVSNTLLTQVLRSPEHARAMLDGCDDKEESDALTFGSIFHCALLEPRVYESLYVVEPEWGDCRNKENKARRDAWRETAAAGTFEVISREHDALAKRMAAAIRRRPFIHELFSGGEPELTLLWHDAETGLRCKCRIDYYVEDLGLSNDLKSAADASRWGFQSSAQRYGYGRQEVHYTAGLRACDLPVNEFYFTAVEKTGTHAAQVFKVDRESSYGCADEVRRGMRLLADCVARDEWPGYPDGVQEISIRTRSQ